MTEAASPFLNELGGMMFVGILYFVITLVFSIILSYIDTHLFGPKPRYLLANIVGSIAIIQVAVAVIRRIVKAIPYPFDGYGGYDHRRIADINGGVIISFTLFSVQTTLAAKLHNYLTELGKPYK